MFRRHAAAMMLAMFTLDALTPRERDAPFLLLIFVDAARRHAALLRF